MADGVRVAESVPGILQREQTAFQRLSLASLVSYISACLRQFRSELLDLSASRFQRSIAFVPPS